MMTTTTKDRDHEQHERARQHQYRRAFANWVRDIIRSDTTGRYYPFILSSISIPMEVMRAQTADKYRRIAIIRACERATAGLTTRAKGNPTRQHRDDTLRVVFVPAVKTDGSVHIHGWCRVPASDTTTALLTWKEDRYYTCSGDAPSSLVAFSDTLCDRLNTKNMWWNLKDDAELGSVDYAERVLKREQREWGQVELQPGYAFVRKDAA